MPVPTRTQLTAPETEEVEKKIAKLNLVGSPVPLKLGTSLEKYEKLDLTPTTGTEFARGTKLTDFLEASNSDEIIKDLGILIAQRGVVFFRDQDINIEQMKTLISKLGVLTGKPESSKLHVHPCTEDTSELGDEVSIITSDRQNVYDKVNMEKSTFASMDWHSDITFEPIPSDYTMLKLHTLPTINGSLTGGDTIFASGYEVYDRLSPSFAKYLETLEAIHEARFFQLIADGVGIKLREGERGSPGNVGRHLEAVHPVIRTNPVTGWKSVFVNQAFTKRILGVTKDESDMILNYLFSLVTMNHDLQVRFKWEKNSVAIWDNRSFYHSATYDYIYTGLKRQGDRVVSLGEKPYFDASSKSRREALGLKPQ